VAVGSKDADPPLEVIWGGRDETRRHEEPDYITTEHFCFSREKRKMFKFTLSLILVAPFALVLSQNSTSSNNTQLGIQVIEANFQNSGIVPSLLAQFDPVALLDVSFGKGSLTPGQNLSVADVQPTPKLSLVPANSSVTLGPKLTLAMVDADVVGTDESQGQTRHWLVNSVTVGQGSTLDFSTAKNITNYAAPLPATGSGPHRYVMLLYTQPDSFTPPANLSSTTGVGKFNFPAYVKSTGLQGPVAGFYIQVEVGVATVSLSSTSAVITSTLAAAAPGSSSAASQAPSPSAKGDSQKATASFMLCLFAIMGSLLL